MTESGKGRYRTIADYAIIGDTRTAALVASDGSLDWWCCPRFDSPAIFCSLLDAEKGGRFRIGPQGQSTSSRAYVDATNVLTMTYSLAGGQYRLTDFMPIAAATVRDGHSRILRRVEGLAGEAEIDIEFRPTLDFGRAMTRIEMLPEGALARGGNATLLLRSPVPLQANGSDGAGARFRIKAGERLDFCLDYDVNAAGAVGKAADADHLLSETLDYWRDWAGRCTYRGPYRDLVQRSTLVLKLLTHAPTGAIIAAPTTSLPEEVGGARNWDYRYTWIRDSSLILHALMLTGYHDESHAFFSWLESLCIKCRGDLQIMYTVDGGQELPEKLLPHLEGYRQSRPVRIGNAAAGQKQLDIYGELLDAAYFCFESMRPPRPELCRILSHLADQAAARWHEPDQGIWEVRSGPRHYLYSKLRCWVALDRALRLAQKGQLRGDIEHWRGARDDIRGAILAEGYDKELGAFTQAFGVKALDASALTIALLGFLPASDPRVRSTIARIREQLSSHGLKYRYLNEDGLPGAEAAFALCNFWLVDNLVLARQIDEARQVFEKTISYGNDLGLFSEEFDPLSGELLGNYPQGFTHLALIRSAVNLAKTEG
jgi:GH15 family glucan-1,4-alpha-glucosidase